MTTSERYGSLADDLDRISEQLGDLSIDLVRGALRAGSRRPDADKRLASARRSVDKAAHVLRTLATADGHDGGPDADLGDFDDE